MKNLFSLMAAIVAITLVALPASADEKKGKRLDMAGADQAAIMTELNAGNEVCVGSGKMKTCMILNPVTREIRLMEVGRPNGINQNVVINRILPMTPNGEFVRHSSGTFLPSIQDVRGTLNGPGVLANTVSGAVQATFNGFAPSLVQALSNPCRGDSVCNSTIIGISNDAAEAVAVSESNAGAQAGITSVGTGTCGSTGCPTGRKP